MANLMEIQRQTAELSAEEKEGLLAYLIQELPSPGQAADDAEVLRREEEMDAGRVRPVSHEEFLKQVGRR
jgi:hypothetical protein